MAKTSSHVTIVGTIIADSELRDVNNGPVMEVTMSVFDGILGGNENPRLDDDGNKIYLTTLYTFSFWKEAAEKAFDSGIYKKGIQIVVSGHPELQVWINQKSGEAQGKIIIRRPNVLSPNLEFEEGGSGGGNYDDDADAAPARSSGSRGNNSASRSGGGSSGGSRGGNSGGGRSSGGTSGGRSSGGSGRGYGGSGSGGRPSGRS